MAAPINWSSRHLVNLCKLFGENFNIMSAFFSTNRPSCRKKSILAEVSFGAKRD